MELIVHDSPGAVAEAASARIADLISTSKTRFSLGLAGGSTPEATYKALRGRAAGWAQVDAWLSDERWVPPDHERSNGRLAAEAILDHVDANFLRPTLSESMMPEDTAAYYEAELRSIHMDRPPDLVMLGLGEDGHTASLFPDTQAIAERQRWFVANHVPQLGEDRLTATFPLLWSARLLMVVVVGANKAVALKSSFEKKTPAGRLDEGNAEVEWYVDRDAASLLA